jgi:hypothetical protein
VDLDEDDIIIFPEILAAYATRKFRCKVGIWWLSVDNAINWNPRLNYKNIPQPIFENKQIIHFYQSEYAHQYLLDKSAKIRVPLYDFTANDQEITNTEDNTKIFDIAIFPSKGGQLAKNFTDAEQSFKYVQIANMSKKQVLTNLRKSHIYIDFGNQPGKDRVPREASMSGCIVFLHRQGAANFYEDSPLDDFFLFTSEDILTGNLAERIRFALDNLIEMRNFQSYYNNKIINERIEFEFQCNNYFTTNNKII